MRATAVFLTAIATSLLTVSAWPQQPTAVPETGGPKAAEVAHGALLDLVAWETDKARDTLAAHEQAFAGDVTYQTALGMLRAEEGKTSDALAMLAGAAKADARDPAPEYYRGEVLYWLKKNGDAAKAWQTAADRAKAALAAAPDDARAAYYRGAALVRLQKTQEARQALQSAADHGYDPLLTTYQTGLSYFVEGQWTKAQDTLGAVLALESRFAYAYFYRGLAASKLGRKDSMINDLNQFVKLAPNAPDAGIAKSLLSAYSR
jgi:tetratricopeptide (TPR) repeat protein